MQNMAESKLKLVKMILSEARSYGKRLRHSNYLLARFIQAK